MIAELQEFASFEPAAQRYIRRSLDVAFERTDSLARWSRDEGERDAILIQSELYQSLGDIRAALPRDGMNGPIDAFMGGIITLSAYDLAQNRIRSFGAYRFLYERLFGAEARPWLPAAYCAAAALPHLHPTNRRNLLQSISEAAATAPGWSANQPAFFPEWVEKVDVTAA